MKALVIAEHDNRSLKKPTFHAVGAAREIAGEKVDVLVAGLDCRNVAEEAARINGIRCVLLAESQSLEHFLPENFALLAARLARGYSHVIAPASATGRNILPRAAALLDCAQVSGVSRIIDPFTFERPVYAGSAIETVRSEQQVNFITVIISEFEAAPRKGGEAAIEEIAGPEDSGLARFIGIAGRKSKRPALEDAEIVVAGGQGIGSAENFYLVEKLADCLGAAIGTTRAAADAGFAPYDLQIGQSGRTVRPQLYIGAGVSGTVQHVAGIRKAKIIVAINNDPNAKIFEFADYALVADAPSALADMIEVLST